MLQSRLTRIDEHLAGIAVTLDRTIWDLVGPQPSDVDGREAPSDVTSTVGSIEQQIELVATRVEMIANMINDNARDVPLTAVRATTRAARAER